MYKLKYKLDIKLHCKNEDYHVLEAEWNNHTIKERVLSLYHRLPCNNTPRVVIRELVLEITRMINYLSENGGVLEY